jgi:hypothetical protein
MSRSNGEGAHCEAFDQHLHADDLLVNNFTLDHRVEQLAQGFADRDDAAAEPRGDVIGEGMDVVLDVAVQHMGESTEKICLSVNKPEQIGNADGRQLAEERTVKRLFLNCDCSEATIEQPDCRVDLRYRVILFRCYPNPK